MQAVKQLIRDVASGIQPIDVLLIEGAIIHAPYGTGAFHRLSGFDQPMKDIIADLAKQARYVVAVGTCSAFGGMTASDDNLCEVTGMQYCQHDKVGLLPSQFVSLAGLPVINIAGCPVHPQWVTETLMMIKFGMMSVDALDSLGRPRFYADKLVHHGCIKNEYYEYKASAQKPSDLGCMMEHLGCVGTFAHADCNERLWNGSGSCTRAGYPCIDCTSAEFGGLSYPLLETPKVAGIPVGLPVDMPKAWFIALSSFAKAATPIRLQQNAVADHIKVAPEIKRRG